MRNVVNTRRDLLKAMGLGADIEKYRGRYMK